jgi:hypothetical protein
MHCKNYFHPNGRLADRCQGPRSAAVILLHSMTKNVAVRSRGVPRILSSHTQKAAWKWWLTPILPMRGPGLMLLQGPGTSDDLSCPGKAMPAALIASSKRLTGLWRCRGRSSSVWTKMRLMTGAQAEKVKTPDWNCWLSTRGKRQSISIVSASANPIGEYWSCISPSMSMIVIGHWLLY